MREYFTDSTTENTSADLINERTSGDVWGKNNTYCKRPAIFLLEVNQGVFSLCGLHDEAWSQEHRSVAQNKDTIGGKHESNIVFVFTE